MGVGRLLDQHKRAQARRKETQVAVNQLVDPVTGQPFFEPKRVARTSKFTAARHEGQSVCDYLYTMGWVLAMLLLLLWSSCFLLLPVLRHDMVVLKCSRCSSS